MMGDVGRWLTESIVIKHIYYYYWKCYPSPLYVGIHSLWQTVVPWTDVSKDHSDQPAQPAT